MKGKIAILLFVVVVASTAAAMRDRAGHFLSAYLKPRHPDPVPVLTLKARDYQVKVFARGELTGFATTPILAPRIRSGSLKISWLVDEGSLVAAGDPLIRFDSTDAQISLQKNQNTVRSYNYQIEKSENDSRTDSSVLSMDSRAAGLELQFANKQVRRDEEIFSRWEIEESLMSASLARYKEGVFKEKKDLKHTLSAADLKLLGIQKKKAEGQVSIARDTLSSLTLESPREGVVIYRETFFNPTQVGSEVWPGQTLLELASVGRFRGQVQVYESDVTHVRKGQTVEVTLEAYPGRRFTGTINQVARVARQISRKDPRKYFSCDVDLQVPLEIMKELKPGLEMEAQIVTASYSGALVVPKSAVFKEESRFVSFVQTESGFEKRPVEIVDSDFGYYVVKGLKAGDGVCLRHPFEDQKLRLPDFNAPTAPTQNRRFIIFG